MLQIGKDPERRGGYLLHAECVVRRERDEVFEYFSQAGNLQQLTPDWMHFHIDSPRPVEMRPGAIMDYRLRVRGFPLRWQSEITSYDPPRRFVDEARRGPYRWWHHEHLFEPCEHGTVVVDHVRYAVPGGALVHALFVRRDLMKIFTYRQQKLQELFPTS